MRIRMYIHHVPIPTIKPLHTEKGKNPTKYERNVTPGNDIAKPTGWDASTLPWPEEYVCMYAALSKIVWGKNRSLRCRSKKPAQTPIGRRHGHDRGLCIRDLALDGTRACGRLRERLQRVLFRA